MKLVVKLICCYEGVLIGEVIVAAKGSMEDPVVAGWRQCAVFSDVRLG